MTVDSNKHIILTNCQALFLKIKINYLSIFDILLVYRPSSTPTQLFTSELTHILIQIPLNKLIILSILIIITTKINILIIFLNKQ